MSANIFDDETGTFVVLINDEADLVQTLGVSRV
jgi:uncharacterized protein YbdZ (MbtH family)